MQFKKLLLISALSACMAYTVTACSDTTSSSAASLQAQYQANRLTKERLQEWINGLQVAFPLYNITLQSYEDKGNDLSLATVAISMGQPASQRDSADNGIYVSTLVKLNIEHGVKVENNVQSIARIDYEMEIDDASSPELLEFKSVILEILEKAQAGSENLAIIQPNGEFYSTTKSIQAFDWSKEDFKLTIPSYNSELQTYDGRKLVSSQVQIPSMTVENTLGNRRVVLYDIQATSKDRPIRDAVYDLNGQVKATIGKMEVFEDEKNLMTLEGFEYTENAKVDANGLMSAQFGMKFSGQEDFSKKMQVTQSTQGVRFQFDMTGQMKNLPADKYIAISQNMINNPEAWMDEGSLLSDVTELLAHGPQLDIEKLTVTLNGHQGEGALKMALPPLADSDKSLPLTLLLLSKLDAEGRARIPVEWFELAEPDKQKREELIVGLLMGFSGYIERQDNYLVSSFSYKGGEMLVNGRPFNFMR